jgi:hypothetical protein
VLEEEGRRKKKDVVDRAKGDCMAEGRGELYRQARDHGCLFAGVEFEVKALILACER